MTMTPAEVSIATTRLLADVQALAKNVSDALNSSSIEDRQRAWRNSADSLGGVRRIQVRGATKMNPVMGG